MESGTQTARSQIERFVRINWVGLAAASWRAYMLLGRGALLISVEDIKRWEAGLSLRLHPPYISTTPVKELTGLISLYDPFEAIVLAVTTSPKSPQRSSGDTETTYSRERPDDEGESVTAWVFSGRPTPPAAHVSVSS